MSSELEWICWGHVGVRSSWGSCYKITDSAPKGHDDAITTTITCLNATATGESPVRNHEKMQHRTFVFSEDVQKSWASFKHANCDQGEAAMLTTLPMSLSTVGGLNFRRIEGIICGTQDLLRGLTTASGSSSLQTRKIQTPYVLTSQASSYIRLDD